MAATSHKQKTLIKPNVLDNSSLPLKSQKYLLYRPLFMNSITKPNSSHGEVFTKRYI